MKLVEIPTYYISMKDNYPTKNRLEDQGFVNINWFPGVNGRKMDTKKLLTEGKISKRVYYDLQEGRIGHSNMSSMGAIGCSLSHVALWELCIKENLPYIVIAEEDLVFIRKFTAEDQEFFINMMKTPNTILLSPSHEMEPTSRPDHHLSFYGTHFYIASNGACRQLLKHAFPLEVQVDWFISHCATIEAVNLQKFKVARQLKGRRTTINDDCLPCYLPQTFFKFLIICILTILTIILATFLITYSFRRISL